MSYSITPFTYRGTAVRVVESDSQPWFVASDIAKILGYSAATAMTRTLDDDEKGMQTVHTLGGEQNLAIINEAGLYSAILRSRRSEAKEFKRWVTHDVLPSIRRHGGYIAGQDNMSPEEMALASMRWLQSKIEEQANQLAQQAPKVLFADSVAASHTSILVGELAKILKGNGIDTGQQRLFAWLRDHDYLISRRGDSWNSPTQKAMNLGLFEVKETTNQQPDGTVRINRTTKVTGKGQQYFIAKFLGAAEQAEAVQHESRAQAT
ncbi:MAG: phage antirepressor KilAC domain-containing protein [Actinomycetaceae bacterium]|nr:phage antirepressor KilAC domain-containing protein [Actinomycetaceae bacterium]MDY5273626.1 phage antirepressor KilAC domain-containing protein [Arcanobacterium sp.]